MKTVEQVKPGFQWADPLQGKELQVDRIGSDLQITGLFPTYKSKSLPCDLIHKYDEFPKQLAIGRQRTGTRSPETYFASADTDEELIAFVRRFGPVVAKEYRCIYSDPDSGEPYLPFRQIARQDLRELRNEQTVYRAALSLVMQLKTADYDFDSAQRHIKIIAASIRNWPGQWERETSLGRTEPKWKLHKESLERIDGLSLLPRDPILSDEVSGRIVICELLNAFPSTIYPNPIEMHSSIRFGIRPLLYSILRRQFIYTREFAICENTECRNFFNIDRAGQTFCRPECSLHHRQRVYWQERGKKLRKKRTAQRRKIRK